MELKAIITAIVRQFLDAFERNRLLGVECLFRFTSREHKDSIMSNYESITTAPQAAPVASESEEELLPQVQQPVEAKQPVLNVWTQDEDALLIDNYEQFKELPKRERFEYLATLITNKSPKECYRRAKILKIKSLGKDGARQISQQLFLEKKGDITRAKVAFALKQFLSVKGKNAGPYVNYLHKIAGDFQKFKQEEENLLLFGS